MTEPFAFPAFNGMATASGALPDHAVAFIELLQQAIDRIEAGQTVPEVAQGLELPIRIAARKV